MRELLCRMLGHHYRYNFPSIPTKCICARCRQKLQFNTEILRWYKVTEFDDKRSDKTLINDWHK